MARLRRRSNYVILAVVLLLIVNFVLLSRSDRLPRIVVNTNGGTSANTESEPASDRTPKPNPGEPIRSLTAQIPMGYGTAARPPLDDGPSISIADLPHSLLPGDGNSNRLIIVGDVHGQLKELKELMDKVNFDQKTDHLILAGDMINKGPDSAGVVQYAMDMNASAVRGNHEDRVLLSRKEGERNSNGKENWLGTMLENIKNKVTATDKDEEPPLLARPGTEDELSVASSFTPAQLAWLEDLPIILRTGPFPTAKSTPWNAGTLAIVHAGLVPGMPLDKQAPQSVMTMRTLAYPGELVRKEVVRKRLEAKEKARREKIEKEGGKKIEGYIMIDPKDVIKEMQRLAEEGLDLHADRGVLFPLEGKSGMPWSEVWSRYQSNVKDEEDRIAVVYGHDAKAGLRAGDVDPEVELDGTILTPAVKPERYAFGLDSGCVYGSYLSALVLETKADGDIRHSIVQVPCQKTAEEPKD